MLLFAKQWGRAAGCVLAALVFLFTLRSLDILRPYPELLNLSHGDIAKENSDGQSHAETPGDFAGGSDSNGSEGGLPEKVESAPEPTEDASTSPILQTTSATVHHIYLEGTRTKTPDAVSTPPAGLPGAVDEPAATETGFRKTVVMGKMSSENTDWVGELGDWQSAVYTVDVAENETSPTGLKTKMNKAKEVTPYLTYIVEHYDSFPDMAVFVHAHRNGWPAAWHNDAKGYDAVNMLNQLKTEAVLERGYVNLRCITDPGCPAEINLNRDPPDQSHHAEIAYPYVFGDFFNMTIDEVKQQVPIIATPCCAQFGVSKQQVMKRPKTEYERYLKLIEDSKYDDETLGTVMEYMWHILFGQEAVHCENTQQCWKFVYGRKNGWTNFGRRGR